MFNTDIKYLKENRAKRRLNYRIFIIDIIFLKQPLTTLVLIKLLFGLHILKQTFSGLVFNFFLKKRIPSK